MNSEKELKYLSDGLNIMEQLYHHKINELEEYKILISSFDISDPNFYPLFEHIMNDNIEPIQREILALYENCIKKIEMIQEIENIIEIDSTIDQPSNSLCIN